MYLSTGRKETKGEIMEFILADPVEKNRKLYENACKKFNFNSENSLFSWQLKKVFNEYIDNGGFVGLMSFSTPNQIQDYAYIYSYSFWRKFWNYDIVIIMNQLPIKLPYNIFFLFRKMKWYFIWRNKVLNKELKIWKSMKKNGCYAGPDPRIKHKSSIKFIPVK